MMCGFVRAERERKREREREGDKKKVHKTLNTKNSLGEKVQNFCISSTRPLVGRHFAVHIMSALHQRRQHGGNDGDSREDSRRRRRRRRRSSSNLPNGKEKEPPTLPKPSLEKQKRVEDKRRRRGKHHQQIRKNVFWSLLFAVAIAWNGMARNAYRSIASRLMRSDVVVVFTSDELEKQSLHLSLVGEVFDVSRGGEMFYGEGKEYHFFIGKDQTRGFLSGREEEGSADVDAMTNSEVLEVEKWIQFYRSGGSRGTYRKRGVLGDGWFYDENGKETERVKRFWDRVKEAQIGEKKEKKSDDVHPTCRAAWTEERGGTVWCDPLKNSTPMYPRLNARNGLCECYEDQGYSDLRKLYDNCNAKSTRCFTG